MATISSQKPIPDTKSNHSIDLQFDLDEVLTPTNQYFTVDNCRGSMISEVAVLPSLKTVDVAKAITIIGIVGTRCTVCMEGFDLSNDEVKQVPNCGHIYHSACITTWLSLYKSCPLCRRSISE